MANAAIFLFLSALLHVIGAGLTGFQGVGLFLLFPAVLYSVLALGLRRHVVWVAWVTLICMLGGSAGTVIELARGSIVPLWVLILIILADLLCAAFLGRALLTHYRTHTKPQA